MYQMYNDLQRSSRPPRNIESDTGNRAPLGQDQGPQGFGRPTVTIAHDWLATQQAAGPVLPGANTSDRDIELTELGQVRHQPRRVSFSPQAQPYPCLSGGDYEASSQPRSVVSQLMATGHPSRQPSLVAIQETTFDQEVPSSSVHSKRVLKSLKREIESALGVSAGRAIGSVSLFTGLTTKQINNLKLIATSTAATAGVAFIPLLSASLSYAFGRPEEDQDIETRNRLVFSALGSAATAAFAVLGRLVLNDLSPVDPIREDDTQTVHRQAVIKPLEKFFKALQKTVKNFGELPNKNLTNTQIMQTFDNLVANSPGFRRDISDMVKSDSRNQERRLAHVRTLVSDTLEDMAKNGRKPLDYSSAVKANEIIPSLWGLINMLDNANGGLDSNVDSNSPEYRLFENLIKGLYTGAKYCSAGYSGQVLQRFSEAAVAILKLDKIEETVGQDIPFSIGKDFVDYYPDFAEKSMEEILSEPEVFNQLKELYIHNYKNPVLIHDLEGQEASQQKEVYKESAAELIKSYFRDKINIELSDKHPQIQEKSPGFGHLIFSYYEPELPILMDNVVAKTRLHEKIDAPERPELTSHQSTMSVLSFS